MSKESSFAPKERVNIVFKPSTGDLQAEKELPLRLLMLGDYSLSNDDRVLENVAITSIDKGNFDNVLSSKNIQLNMIVDNLLDDDVSELPVSLNIQKLSDFSPDTVVSQVPELAKLIEVRHALTALKGPLGNVPAFRKHMQKVLENEQTRESLFTELEINTVE